VVAMPLYKFVDLLKDKIDIIKDLVNKNDDPESALVELFPIKTSKVNFLLKYFKSISS
jgi:hypothetical protein